MLQNFTKAYYYALENTPGFLEYFGSVVQGFLRQTRHFESGESPGKELATAKEKKWICDKVETKSDIKLP